MQHVIDTIDFNTKAVRSTVYDTETGTVTVSLDGVEQSSRPFTDDEAALAATMQEGANRSAIEAAIAEALTRLDQLIAAPAVDTVPAGTMTTAQLSNVARAMRDAVQANRAGAQEVALTLKRTIRLVRGDFDNID